MKSNPLGPFLVGVFVACAIVVAWLATRYYFSVKDSTKLTIQTISINNTRTAVQSLANEAIEYSRRNPAMNPILEKFEIKPRSTNAPAEPSATPAK